MDEVYQKEYYFETEMRQKRQNSDGGEKRVETPWYNALITPQQPSNQEKYPQTNSL